MNNTEIRAELKAAKIPYWKVAEKLGVHENTIVRRMRKELSDDDRNAFCAAIVLIKAEQAKENTGE